MGRHITDEELRRFVETVNSQLRQSGISIQSVTFTRDREHEPSVVIKEGSPKTHKGIPS